VRKVFHILLFLTLFFGTGAASVSIEAAVDKSTITVGDPIKYSIKIARNKETTVLLPPPGEQLGWFEIKDYQKLDEYSHKGKIIMETRFVITAYDTGDFIIPPMIIPFTSTSGDSGELLSQRIPIRVNSVLDPQNLEAKDIKGQLELPEPDLTKYYWAGGGLFLILILVLLWWFRWRSKPGEEIEAETVILKSPHDEAYENLRVLESSDLLARGEFKEFHIRLADIIRHFLGRRYEYDAMEMTSWEILMEMRRYSVKGDEEGASLGAFLESCDLVKFAKHIPENEESFQNFAQGRQVVDRSKDIFMTTTQVQGSEVSSSRLEMSGSQA